MREIIVRVSDLRVASGDSMLTTVGLGSCVAIALYDDVAKVAGLAHVLLPSPSLARVEGRAGKVPHTAVPALLAEMQAQGASVRRITARLAGGASMFATLATPGTIQMGERNIVATRAVLAQHDIPVTAEAVGGTHGRTVRLHAATGRVEVSSVRHGIEHL